MEEGSLAWLPPERRAPRMDDADVDGSHISCANVCRGWVWSTSELEKACQCAPQAWMDALSRMADGMAAMSRRAAAMMLLHGARGQGQFGAVGRRVCIATPGTTRAAQPDALTLPYTQPQRARSMQWQHARGMPARARPQACLHV